MRPMPTYVDPTQPLPTGGAQKAPISESHLCKTPHVISNTRSDLHLGDCLVVLATMPSASVDLVYMDPPFFTGETWRGKAGSFQDRWASLDAYLEFIRGRVAALRQVLRPTGTLYLHCDDHAGSHLGVMLDGIFGEGAVAGIKWKRSSGTNSRRGFTRTHDTIWMATNGPAWTWNDHGHTDLWLDIPPLNARAAERVGYPTQKPVALLERIIACSSNPGDVVLDPFMGSGTTLVAARNLGRHGIGIDSSRDALAVAAERLGVPLGAVA